MKFLESGRTLEATFHRSYPGGAAGGSGRCAGPDPRAKRSARVGVHFAALLC